VGFVAVVGFVLAETTALDTVVVAVVVVIVVVESAAVAVAESTMKTTLNCRYYHHQTNYLSLWIGVDLVQLTVVLVVVIVAFMEAIVASTAVVAVAADIVIIVIVVVTTKILNPHLLRISRLNLMTVNSHHQTYHLILLTKIAVQLEDNS